MPELRAGLRPPRGYCPICVVETTQADEVVLTDRGTVTNYTVVTPVQYYGQHETEPFVRASVLLDGEGGMMNLQDVIDVPVDDVRVGMRVAAVWKPARGAHRRRHHQPQLGQRRGLHRGVAPHR